MKFRVTKTALIDGLQRVQNVVGARTTVPILSNVLITVEKTGVTLTTTDLDVTIQATIEAEVTKTGAGTLPVKRFSGIIRELPEGAIDIEMNEKNVAHIKSESSYFKIIGLSADEFPKTAKADGKFAYTIEQNVLKEMLRKTSYAVSTDETRAVLNGLLLSFRGGKLTMVSTDGRRLALVEKELDFPKDAETEIILPPKPTTELIHSLGSSGDMKIVSKGNMAIFDYGKTVLATKLVEGTYPNYRQVIPTQCEERITIERESLLLALRRVSQIAHEKSGAARFLFAKNKLTITMTTTDVGESEAVVPIKYNGKEISVAFNPDYAMEPLKVLTNDEIFFEITDELSPGVIKADIPFLYVIMPVRIS